MTKESETCTCESEEHDSHMCPYAMELYDSEEECTCCPYCEEQCAQDI